MIKYFLLKTSFHTIKSVKHKFPIPNIIKTNNNNPLDPLLCSKSKREVEFLLVSDNI